MEYLPPPGGNESSPPLAGTTPQRKRGNAAGALGGIGATLLALLVKFKFVLLFGLKLLAPAWTFLLSLWIYVALFGWRFAIVIMLVLLAHELGHYFAFRAYGLPARLPAFVPLLGAFTAGAPPDDLEHDAYIALAGPLVGLALAAGCYGVGVATGDRFWYACADVSAFLNLFNMLPVPPFDGGRVINAISPVFWFVGIALFVGAAIYLHVPLIFVLIIAFLGSGPMIATWRGQVDPRAARMTTGARWRVGIWYLATLMGLVAMMAQSHALASPGAAGPSW